jgi:ACS family glucarate transporter-like MFS transporter
MTETSDRGAWKWVALLFLTATAGYLCRTNLSIAGAQMMPEFGMTQAQLGRVFSAFLFGYALFQFPGGWLADRLGAGRVLRVLPWLWVGLTVAVAAMPSAAAAWGGMATLLALRFVMGAAAAPTYPASSQGVAQWVAPGSRASANGWVIGSVGFGSAIAPILITAVMGRWGWRASLVASAVPAFVMAVVWLLVHPPAEKRGQAPFADDLKRKNGANGGEPDRHATDFAPEFADRAQPGKRGQAPFANDLKRKKRATVAGSAIRSRAFALLTLSYSLQGYVGYIFVFWFYLYLVQERHFDIVSGALFSSLPWILSMIAIPGGGAVADYLSRSRLGPVWGRRLVPIVGMAGSGVLLSVGAHTANAHVAAVALALSTALILCVEGPFWATMNDLSGTRSGMGGGIMNTGCNIGGLISPALTPALAATMGWEPALHLAAGLAVFAGILWFWITPRR